jgi:hypothetical protein
MAMLQDAIAANRKRVKYQYSPRLPLPRYQAWELLTDALAHVNAHGDKLKGNITVLEHGDWDALVILRDARNSLCTPARPTSAL